MNEHRFETIYLTPITERCIKCHKSIMEIEEEIFCVPESYMQAKTIKNLNKFNPCKISDNEFKWKMLLG